MPCVNVIVADTDAQARRLFTSAQQVYTDIFRSKNGKVPAPIDDIDTYWQPMEKAQVENMLAYSFVSSVDTVRTQLQQFLQRTRVNELMVCTMVYEQDALLRSYELLSKIGQELYSKLGAHPVTARYLF